MKHKLIYDDSLYDLKLIYTKDKSIYIVSHANKGGGFLAISYDANKDEIRNITANFMRPMQYQNKHRMNGVSSVIYDAERQQILLFVRAVSLKTIF